MDKEIVDPEWHSSDRHMSVSSSAYSIASSSGSAGVTNIWDIFSASHPFNGCVGGIRNINLEADGKSTECGNARESLVGDDYASIYSRRTSKCYSRDIHTLSMAARMLPRHYSVCSDTDTASTVSESPEDDEEVTHEDLEDNTTPPNSPESPADDFVLPKLKRRNAWRHTEHQQKPSKRSRARKHAKAVIGFAFQVVKYHLQTLSRRNY